MLGILIEQACLLACLLAQFLDLPERKRERERKGEEEGSTHRMLCKVFGPFASLSLSLSRIL